MRCFFVLVWICSPSRILGFGVQLEGVIDLGPNWGYNYKLSPFNSTKLLKQLPIISESRTDKKDMDDDIDTRDERKQNIFPSQSLKFAEDNDSVNNLSIVTQIMLNRTDKKSQKVVTIKSKIQSQTSEKFQLKAGKNLKKNKKTKIHNDSKSNESEEDVRRKVKKHIGRYNVYSKINNENSILDFMNRVKQKAMKMWNKMINKAKSVDFKRKVTALKKKFKRKYQQFMGLNKKQKMKTKLGSQKFILNTIETSNRLMKSLVNSLSTFENSIKGGYRKLQQQIKKVKRLQYAYACKKFGVCRTSDDFGDYLIELLNIILQTDIVKIKQAADALTELVKTNDFTETIDVSTQDKLKKQMANIELWDPLIVKAMFVILRNVLSHKNQPLVVMNQIDLELSNKTVAFHEIIDTLSKNIYKPEKMTDFINIKKQFEEWRDGSFKEIQKALHSLIELIKKGLQQIDMPTAEEIDRNMNIILKPMFS